MGVTAVINDTVGTLVTEYFEDDTALLGVIIGTGFNVAYWEKVRLAHPRFTHSVTSHVSRLLSRSLPLFIRLTTDFKICLGIGQVANIPKYIRANPSADPSHSMCINMEVGNFDSPHMKVLKYVANEYDDKVLTSNAYVCMLICLYYSSMESGYE
eukprot:1340389-Amorphochlora_amoeboformis.AAC.1